VAEKLLLVLREEAIAPLDRRAQSLLAFRQIARSSGEELEALIEALEQVLLREQLDSRCRELDGERQIVETAADLDDKRPVAIECETRLRASARSVKSSIASVSARGGTGYSCSPERWSGARLVTRSLRRGAWASSWARGGAASVRCSKLSSRSSSSCAST
jgi:hypothetical protein